jgi:hypothetical protein
MRKPLVLTLAFIVSMVLGAVLLLLITVGIGFIQIAVQQRNHSGIGAVAGGSPKQWSYSCLCFVASSASS